ncbi:transcriptional regulator, GntR family [Rhizobiales bacterium GAS188]|nr:transcriptional regulator, GntR family [Rhizobiales bacterium GAS188]
MTLMTEIWTPRLDPHRGTLHEQILEALRREIGSGELPPGARMPTHRHLAQSLGIGIGTVTKAYAQAERTGLLTSRVGRGTFVAGLPDERAPRRHGEGPIELTMNLQALAPSASRLAETLARLRRRPDLGDYVGLAPQPGFDWQRQAFAEWLGRAARYEGVDWRRLLICTGAQQAMALALDEIGRRGDTILTEAATFHGMKVLAEYRGYSLLGLPMDREGLLPEALERAAAETSARILYVQPTLQNPTARSMSRARREAIADIARRRELWIIEGDLYAPLAHAGWGSDAAASALLPLASLAPERVFYVSSVSKALAPGLRVGLLVAPDMARFDRLCLAMRAVCYSASTFGPLIAAQWVTDGTAEMILGEVTREAASRVVLAGEILGSALETPSAPTSLHAWLPLGELEAERLAGQALRQGVLLTSPSALAVAGRSVSGLRLCLGAPADRARLDRALRIIASIMANEAEAPSPSVI